MCAEYEDGSRTRGEVEVDAEQSQGRRVGRVWLEPEVSIHPAAAAAIPTFDAVIIGPGSFYTSWSRSFCPPACARWSPPSTGRSCSSPTC
ncbi:MAG: hypothetical protein DSY84_01480 [Candidatus Neomarinimicrobiota bacterium]|nr:MAG: hypothetical protein DSY84_01480 [Candidatus Neomarinimicrobiota bacterium]